MIELIILLHQIVCIVGNNRWVIIRTCLLHNCLKVSQHLNQAFFFCTQLQSCRNHFGNSDTWFGCFTQHRPDTGISILDERSCIAIEINGFLRIKRHVLTCIHFQDKILQSSQAYNAGNIIRFFFRQAIQLTQLGWSFFRSLNHSFHQIIGIHHGSFTALHLTFRQFYHTVWEVNQSFAPFKAQLIKQDGQYLKMIILLISHYIYHLIDRIVLKTKFGSTDILSHIHRSSVSTEQQLVIQSFRSKVGPYRIVFFAIEEALFKTFHHFILSFQIGIRFVVNLIKTNPHHLIGLIKTGIHPIIHLFPKRTDFGIVSFPLTQHFAGFLHQRWLSLSFCFSFFLVHPFCLILSHQLFYFRFVMLVKSHIIIANQVVAFLAWRFGSFAITIFQPSQHRLADMDSTIVHNIGFHYLIAICRHYICQRITQQIIADVSQV